MSSGKFRGTLLAMLLSIVAAGAAHAGRPLPTDDAGTAASGECQLEGWAERAGDESAQVLSGGCGLGHGLDFGVGLTRLHPGNDTVSKAGIGLKWAPSSGVFDTPFGPLSVGSRLDFDSTRPAVGGWQLRGAGVQALVSLQAPQGFAFHLNAGPTHDKRTHLGSTSVSTAVAWTPVPRAFLFVDWQANDRPREVGTVVRTGGGRWWVLPERLGLDLSAARAAGSHATVWSLGFGWYRIGL